METGLQAFGQHLEGEGMTFRLTIIGGAALLVMGVIERATQDVDCLDPDLPEHTLQAARAFAESYEGPGAPLRSDWRNHDTRDLRKDLPDVGRIGFANSAGTEPCASIHWAEATCSRQSSSPIATGNRIRTTA
jgi:hypothetical protein